MSVAFLANAELVPAPDRLASELTDACRRRRRTPWKPLPAGSGRGAPPQNSQLVKILGYGSQPCDPSVVTAARAGNVIHVDEPALVEAARRADCTLELAPMMGDFVVAGARCSALAVISHGWTAGGCGA